MKKRAVTFYLPGEQHERLRVATAIAGEPVTKVVEQVVADWLAKQAEAIDEASRVLGKLKLR